MPLSTGFSLSAAILLWSVGITLANPEPGQYAVGQSANYNKPRYAEPKSPQYREQQVKFNF